MACSIQFYIAHVSHLNIRHLLVSLISRRNDLGLSIYLSFWTLLLRWWALHLFLYTLFSVGTAVLSIGKLLFPLFSLRQILLPSLSLRHNLHFIIIIEFGYNWFLIFFRGMLLVTSNKLIRNLLWLLTEKLVVILYELNLLFLLFLLLLFLLFCLLLLDSFWLFDWLLIFDFLNGLLPTVFTLHFRWISD